MKVLCRASEGMDREEGKDPPLKLTHKVTSCQRREGRPAEQRDRQGVVEQLRNVFCQASHSSVNSWIGVCF